MLLSVALFCSDLWLSSSSVEEHHSGLIFLLMDFLVEFVAVKRKKKKEELVFSFTFKRTKITRRTVSKPESS